MGKSKQKRMKKGQDQKAKSRRSSSVPTFKFRYQTIRFRPLLQPKEATSPSLSNAPDRYPIASPKANPKDQ
jgi:hypothetical protein